MENNWRHKILYHSAFWVVFGSFYVIVYHELVNDWMLAVRDTLMILGGLFFSVYFNLYYLLPKYFVKRRYKQYSLLLAATLAVSTPLLIFINLFLTAQAAELQAKSLSFIIFDMFILLLAMIVLTTAIKLVKDWFRQQQRNKELEKQSLQSEIRFLKAQVNPHFLFNTLNNIYSLALIKDDRAPEIVLKLSDLLRYMLYECNQKSVALEQEVACIQNYIDLERIRQGDQTEITFNVTGPIGDQPIAPLLFIPFLENCFKHGVNNQIEEGWINIDFSVNEDTLYFKVVNSKPEQRYHNGKVGGIGLANVKRRLELQYPKRHDLKITDSDTQFEVEMWIHGDATAKGVIPEVLAQDQKEELLYKIKSPIP